MSDIKSDPKLEGQQSVNSDSALLELMAKAVVDDTKPSDQASMSEAERKAYEETQLIWQSLAEMGKNDEYHYLLGKPSLRERWVQFKQQARSLFNCPPFNSPPRYAYAMTLALLVGASGYLVLPGKSDNPKIQLASSFSETKTITLADGSVISLGAMSLARVDYSDAQRSIYLTQGEAFFEVSQDKTRPFVVYYDDKQASVLGTAFNVRLGDDLSSVSVAEGKVAVDDSDNSSTNAVILTPGMKVSATIGGELSQPQQISQSSAGEWRSGRKSYVEMPLGELVADLNRYYKPGVDLANQALADLKVTTSFKLDQIESMLVSLENVVAIQLSKDESGRYTINNKQ